MKIVNRAVDWLRSRTLADALDRRYPLRQRYWRIRFAGGPVRALRRWWSLRSTRQLRDLDERASMVGLCRAPGEADADFRARILRDIRA